MKTKASIAPITKGTFIPICVKVSKINLIKIIVRPAQIPN